MAKSMCENNLRQAVDALAQAQHVIALTGAGISVESGIPDFRSPTGLWAQYPPEKYATIEGYVRNPDEVWKLWYQLGKMLQDIQPNSGHRSLAALEELGLLRGVITQNIDNLHQEAGNSHVVEFHGNNSHLRCMQCHKRIPLNLELPGDKAPRCDCGGLMKPDVVLFGEMLPPYAVLESEILIQECDLMLVVGTSATVYPAAELPIIARENGAYIIECNLEPTQLTDNITDSFLAGPAGETLPALLEALHALQPETS